MPYIDSRSGEVVVRIVYDGVPEAGKTTNVVQLSNRISVQRRGELASPGALDERTEFFDWLDFSGGYLDGKRVRCQIVSVPGQDKLAHRRARLLATADVVVFVVDSSAAGVAEAASSIAATTRALADKQGATPIGVIVQMNKRDRSDALSADVILERLGMAESTPNVNSVASAGEGVMETFVLAARLATDRARTFMLGESALTDLPEDEAAPDALHHAMLATERAETLAQEARAREVAAQKAREAAELKAREVAEQQVREEQARKAREAAELKAREAREAQARKARVAAELETREEEARIAREVAARKAREAVELKARDDEARKHRDDSAKRARGADDGWSIPPEASAAIEAGAREVTVVRSPPIPKVPAGKITAPAGRSSAESFVKAAASPALAAATLSRAAVLADRRTAKPVASTTAAAPALAAAPSPAVIPAPVITPSSVAAPTPAEARTTTPRSERVTANVAAVTVAAAPPHRPAPVVATPTTATPPPATYVAAASADTRALGKPTSDDATAIGASEPGTPTKRTDDDAPARTAPSKPASDGATAAGTTPSSVPGEPADRGAHATTSVAAAKPANDSGPATESSAPAKPSSDDATAIGASKSSAPAKPDDDGASSALVPARPTGLRGLFARLFAWLFGRRS